MKRPLLTLLLVLTGALLSACGSEEGRALAEAVNTADLAAVETLIAEGADVNENVRFQGNFTKPVRLALSNSGLSERHEGIALAVIAAGGDANLSWGSGGGEGDPGYTTYALAIVARGGSAKVVEALLVAGARVEGEPGGAALIAAARGNHVEILRLLADAGANLNYKERAGDTALGAAVEAGAREAIAFLEERGAREW